jgi:monoamine oxidase
MMDAIIIGAGMAGLTAAIELKRRGLSYLVLEAAEAPGGRAATRHAPSGTAIDLGAHWLHGEDNPLKNVLAQYDIPYHADQSEHLAVYRQGKKHQSRDGGWLKKAIDPQKARLIEQGLWGDRPLSALAVDPQARETLLDFDAMWSGVDLPIETSAYEFLNDQSTPGGLQVEGGMDNLISNLAKDAGYDHMKFNTAVVSLTNRPECVHVETADGMIWKARMALFTASLGVINSGTVTFSPGLSASMRRHLAGLMMGKMNKIAVEVEPAFFEEQKIPQDMSLLLLDTKHFCHVRSAGSPLINLFISGNAAEKTETLNKEQALAYMKNVLAPVEELRGFETRLVGEPVVTAWVSNPYIRGSYSSCLVGGKRSGPRREDRIIFCGDTFDDQYPASLAGAYRSGKAGAEMLAEFTEEHAVQSKVAAC